jgi:hypothetical protein
VTQLQLPYVLSCSEPETMHSEKIKIKKDQSAEDAKDQIPTKKITSEMQLKM